MDSQGYSLGPNHNPPKQKIHAVASSNLLFLQMAETQEPKKKIKTSLMSYKNFKGKIFKVLT